MSDDVIAELNTLDDLLAAEEELNAALMGLEDANEAFDSVQTTMKILHDHGVTKEFLSMYNSKGELDLRVGTQLIELEYFDSMNKQTIRYAREQYDIALEGWLGDIWKKIKEWLSKIWEAIKNFVRFLIGKMSGMEKNIRKYKTICKVARIPNPSIGSAGKIFKYDVAMRYVTYMKSAVPIFMSQSGALSDGLLQYLDELNKTTWDRAETMVTNNTSKFNATVASVVQSLAKINSFIGVGGYNVMVEESTSLYPTLVLTGGPSNIDASNFLAEGTPMDSAGWTKDGLIKFLDAWADEHKTYSKMIESGAPIFKETLQAKIDIMVDRLANRASMTWWWKNGEDATSIYHRDMSVYSKAVTLLRGYAGFVNRFRTLILKVTNTCDSVANSQASRVSSRLFSGALGRKLSAGV